VEEASVSSEAVAEYKPLVEGMARRFSGVAGAEFDDLVQEGYLKVFLLLRDGKMVSKTAVKNAMRDWVRVCGRKGFAYPMVQDALDNNEAAQPGRKLVFWNDDDTGSIKVAWGRFAEAS
jgi:DNA-directed RNA polymerase specialized sigma24 family protein